MDRYFHFHVTALKTSESERETRRLRGDNELEYSRLLATIEEISDRKKLLIGLQANLQALKDTRDQLVDAEKLSAVGKLAAGVAHEMNNPLTAVLTYSSLLIDKIQTLPEDLLERLPRFEERLKRMKEAATVCKSIADNLLSFSRQSREERIAISIAECIRLTQGLIHMQLTSNQVSLEMDLPDPAPRVLTNPAELQQVFTNLIVNAIHAIGSGGKIILKAREQGDRCIVEVTDNGPGIPPEIQQKIFDPFFTTKPLGEGTGLGLSIVYGIIQNLSGTIEIDSVMGEGTTFRISLPRLSDKDGTHE
jgi:two-component system NtrC family sensor kinase